MTDTLERREAIARIIDPKAWEYHDWIIAEGRGPADRAGIADSLAKADAILALTTSPRVDEGRDADPFDDCLGIHVQANAARHAVATTPADPRATLIGQGWRAALKYWGLDDEEVATHEKGLSLYLCGNDIPADPRVGKIEADLEAAKKALSWAIAEIEGRTRYDPFCYYTAKEQREEALQSARSTLSQIEDRI